ncbi:hypothetical protein ILUMI_06077 [Ignelater luminosus]|uniref:Uncharacterized protein n=1 Tax=Ignelater luminosus TaxID=2038154 RepID=A0A8K0D988_IGNLU|nr:hypothetical protein ILUMI_06077 [Ignelater luminosus]
MKGYKDGQRTQEDVYNLFSMTYPDQTPITRSTVSKIERKSSERGYVRCDTQQHLNVPEDVELNILLEVQENPPNTTRALATNNNTTQQKKILMFTSLHEQGDEKDLELPRDHLVPALVELYPDNEEPDVPNTNLWYQHDGAPPPPIIVFLLWSNTNTF